MMPPAQILAFLANRVVHQAALELQEDVAAREAKAEQ